MPFSVVSLAVGYIGRYGTTALSISIFVGAALPSLSSYLRPYLTLAVLCLLTLAFLRVDEAEIKSRLKQPGLLISSLAWMMIGLPFLTFLIFQFYSLERWDQDVVLAIYIATAAPPVMAAPAFLYMLGLNGALSLAISVAALLIAPITTTVMGLMMLGPSLPLSATGLAAKLSLLLIGALFIAMCIRKLAGTNRLERSSDVISGLNVLLLLVFAIAAMDGVAESLFDNPALTLSVTGLTFLVAASQILVTFLLFLSIGKEDAYAIAHTCGTRNMGLMVAAFGGALPEFTWLWFALGQFPIYLLPMIVRPIVQKYIISSRLSEQTETQGTVEASRNLSPASGQSER
ncbi:MAG: sodium:proton symporter [Epibacterium sp.]|nr:sodium:proton symporter [Epibacterium sp.]